MPKSQLEAQRRALRQIPEYAKAEAIGIYRRAIAALASPTEEMRLTAFLWHQGMKAADLAELFGVTQDTIVKRLSRWKHLTR